VRACVCVCQHLSDNIYYIKYFSNKNKYALNFEMWSDGTKWKTYQEHQTSPGKLSV